MASRSENTVSTGTEHEKHHTSSDNFLLYNNDVSETTPIYNNGPKTLSLPNNQILNTSTTEPKPKIMKKEYGRHYKAEDPSLTGRINIVNGIISKSNLRMQCNPL